MADRIRVDTDQIDRWATELGSVATALDQVGGMLGGVSTGDEWWTKVHINRQYRLADTGGTINIGDARDGVSALRAVLGNYQDRVSSLSGAVRSAAAMFDDTERRIGELPQGTGTEANVHGTVKWGDVFGEQKPLVSNITGPNYIDPKSLADYIQNLPPWAIKLLSTLGIGGNALASALSLGQDLSWEGLGKFLAKSGKNIVKWIDLDKRYSKLANFGKDYANELRWKEFLGLNKYLKHPSKAASKWTQFQTNFSNSFSKGIKSKSTWVVSTITSAIDNFSAAAKGHISGDRAVVETVVETAGSVLLTTAVTAATGAALAAAGVASAPVVAVAAISTGVVMVADWGWKKTVGQYFKDGDGNASGIVESVGMAAGELYDGAKELGAKAWEGISNWWEEKTSSKKSTGWSVSALWA